VKLKGLSYQVLEQAAKYCGIPVLDLEEFKTVGVMPLVYNDHLIIYHDGHVVVGTRTGKSKVTYTEVVEAITYCSQLEKGLPALTKKQKQKRAIRVVK